MKVITVTGYKPMEMGIFKQDDERIVFVKETLRRRLLPMIEDGLEWVLISGQAGVELWTGEVILDLKEEGYEIQLGIFPPFLNQESRWPEPQQEQYLMMIELADFYQPLYNKEYEGAYQFKAKDQWFLEKSEAMLVLFDEDTKGSPSFIVEKAKHYAETHDYPIYIITPLDLQETVEQLQMENPDYWAD
ncbi:hypothetical protein N781_17615 [Pontibacillus halophilus JSM 076056 = DSM 19796]|uniref:Uncharacterized protein n=1 Tax=Pontibacillus halophilus JSM 076056 = DSM 19796 TaxID=1385510 RepID=A0A0A5GJG1_9BACI|nr:DUF1273 domain-containing protein [Pontibacillus halophilus]KGX92124.1 hypothetical protein N781_17615 [Pontibacillus halophilus JSM 076056 = DSM 19796]